MIETSELVDAILAAIEGAKVDIVSRQNDGLHFDAVVISSHFEGKSPIERHRMVLGPLKDLFSSRLHALSVKTWTPEEWERKGNV